MFTGLIETTGTLVRRTVQGRDARLVICADFHLAGAAASGSVGGEPLALGESIAVNGACLTVAAIPTPGGPAVASVFEVDASAETLDNTTLEALEAGSTVNLERAVPLGGRMGGHVVSGHVDGIGTLAERTPSGACVKMTFRAPRELLRFIAPKGSICVNGVSLTVNGVEGDAFHVMMIPHTRERTSFETLPVGAKINLEIDVLARYVARFLDVLAGAGSAADAASNEAWLARLQRAGYL
ncbi:MAG: riboflavin synthase [Polyangiaceae bacterium]|nr:riboflavin synthase [Polyangiaceae bacterium]